MGCITSKNDVWKTSEDVFELFDGGVIARRGPIKAILSSDLAAEKVFDLEGPDGTRLVGAVRQLLLVDSASGDSLVLGTPKPSASAELRPPNKLVFLDAFDGTVADLVYVWKHNIFSQDVVLREKPRLPEGWDPAKVRFQVVTEFFPAKEPEIQAQRVEPENQAAFEDHGVIRFGAMSMIVGKAFAVGPGPAVKLGDLNLDAEGFPVRKEWIKTEDGRYFVVESLAWAEVQACFDAVPTVQEARNTAPVRHIATAVQVPKAAARTTAPPPVRIAQAPYEPKGLGIDFIIVPDVPVTHFLAGTYYIKSNYSNGSSVQFDANCVLKFKNGANMLLYGYMTFPTSAPSAVFTSRDDDLYGEKIQGVPNEANSDGNPTDHLGQPLFIYYVNFSTTVRNVRIRWATKGVRYIGYAGVNVTHYVQDSIFEQSQVGIENYLAASALVSLSNVKQCGVTTPIAGTGWTVGTMSPDCGVKNSSKLPGHESEPAIAVRQLNATHTQIVIVSMINPGSVNSLLMSISSDSGANWANTVIANGVFGNPPMVAAQSDAACAFDSFGNLFVAYNTLTGAALYVSSDSGASFQAVPGFNGSDHNYYGPPRVATGPGCSFPQSVWVCYATQNGVVAKGTGINYMGVGNISSMWTTSSPAMRTNNTICLAQDNAGYPFTDIAVGPNGKVVVVFQHADDQFHNPPRRYYTAINTAGLASNQFVPGACFEINLGWEDIAAMPSFVVNPNATLSWSLTQDKIYLAYTGRACTPISDQPCNDNTDIYVRTSINNGTTWSLPVQVNDDAGTRSQFHPRIAVDQPSGNVAVSWHDCRNDSLNKKAQFFAAVSRDGFSTPKPRNFQLNPGQSDATSISFGYLDYTGLAYLNGHLFPVWADNSNSTNDNPDGSLNPIKFDVYTCNVAY